jgi:acyl carrier protein
MSDQKQEMMRYVVSEVIRRADVRIDEDTPLVSSGFIDSLALVDILVKLEEITQLRIPAGKVQPKDMDTVRLMFSTAQRVGKPVHRAK